MTENTPDYVAPVTVPVPAVDPTPATPVPAPVAPATEPAPEAPAEGVAVFAGGTSHDPSPTVVADSLPAADVNAEVQDAESVPTDWNPADTAAEPDPATVLSELPSQVSQTVDDTSALIREIHAMVTEIHSVIETVAPIVTDALGSLAKNPALKFLGL